MANPPPFRNPSSRAGMGDPRSSTFITRLSDEMLGSKRNKPLSSETVNLRVEDLDPGSGIHRKPQDEPLGLAPNPPAVASRMIAVFTPKGGCGGTVLAVNLGGILGRLGKPAVIVDLDLQLGAVPISLNMRPQRSLAELCREVDLSNQGPIQSGLDRHASGVCILAQGDRIEEVGEVTAERLPRLFDALGQTFPYVIVDGLRDFSDHAVTAMDLAHLILMVVTQDVPSVRAASRSLRLFRRLGYGPDRLRLVLNRFHRKAPVTVAAIENALGQTVEAVLHNDFPLVERALNEGLLIPDLKPSSRLSRDLEAITYHYCGLREAPPRAGLLTRLLGRG